MLDEWEESSYTIIPFVQAVLGLVHNKLDRSYLVTFFLFSTLFYSNMQVENVGGHVNVND